jgi:hypothetical protein
MPVRWRSGGSLKGVIKDRPAPSCRPPLLAGDGGPAAALKEALKAVAVISPSMPIKSLLINRQAVAGDGAALFEHLEHERRMQGAAGLVRLWLHGGAGQQAGAQRRQAWATLQAGLHRGLRLTGPALADHAGAHSGLPLRRLDDAGSGQCGLGRRLLRHQVGMLLDDVHGLFKGRADRPTRKCRLSERLRFRSSVRSR